jgi:hypothetical protein
MRPCEGPWGAPGSACDSWMAATSPAVYAEVFSLPPYNEGPELADEFLERLAEDSRRPGFSLVAACGGGTPGIRLRLHDAGR